MQKGIPAHKKTFLKLSTNTDAENNTNRNNNDKNKYNNKIKHEKNMIKRKNRDRDINTFSNNKKRKKNK